MKIIADYPLWFILFCLLIGGLFSFILYYKNTPDNLKRNIVILLISLRFLLGTLIAFLLLAPLFLTHTRQTEKPLIVIAQDNSSSILLSSDSAYYKNEYLKKLTEIKNKLSQKFEIREYSFADKLQKALNIDYSGKQTNISVLFDEMKLVFAGRNVGAIVLATDGIYNQGSNPLYIAEKLPFPVYCVAMGDTTPRNDLLISSIDYNKTVIYKNSFSVEVNVFATKFAGKKSKITLSKDNNVLFSKDISIQNDRYTETVRFFVDATEKGIQKYRISLQPIAGEFTLINNFYDIYVEVLDNREKILITYNTPHPDISALKQALESSETYQVDVKQVSEIDKPLREYNFIILNQLPDKKFSNQNLFDQIKQDQIPALYILGNQTSYPLFNNLNSGLNIQQSNNLVNEALPSINSNFVLFTLSNEFKQFVLQLPPLTSPFGTYKISPSVNTLFNQKIGSVTTSMPLILFNETSENKSCVIAGEGIWRWRLTSYVMYNSHQVFDEMICKLAQYLSVKTDKSNFRIKIRQFFNENENIRSTAELYNDARELINDPEINFNIIDSSGKKYPYIFSRVYNTYSLDAGAFPVGDYKWQASTKIGEKLYQKNGAFTIQKINLEALNTISDINLLRNLAAINNGEVISAKNIENVVDKINSNQSIKPLSYHTQQFTELISKWWFLALIILIATAEWFIRKFNGLY